MQRTKPFLQLHLKVCIRLWKFVAKCCQLLNFFLLSSTKSLCSLPCWSLQNHNKAKNSSITPREGTFVDSEWAKRDVLAWSCIYLILFYYVFDHLFPMHFTKRFSSSKIGLRQMETWSVCSQTKRGGDRKWSHEHSPSLIAPIFQLQKGNE